MKKLSILIISQQDSLREQLMNSLKDVGVSANVLESKHALEGMRYLKMREPDVLFLDVEIPGMSAFEFLDLVDFQSPVILIANCGGHAVKAFDYGLFDFLLRPILPERLAQVLNKLCSSWTHLSDDIIQDAGHLKSLLVGKGRKLVKIEVDHISHLRSDRDYTWIHTINNEVFLSSMGLGKLKSKLSPSKFLQIHRSILVNMDHVQELFKEDGRSKIILKNKLEMNIGRKYMSSIKPMIC